MRVKKKDGQALILKKGDRAQLEVGDIIELAFNAKSSVGKFPFQVVKEEENVDSSKMEEVSKKRKMEEATTTENTGLQAENSSTKRLRTDSEASKASTQVEMTSEPPKSGFKSFFFFKKKEQESNDYLSIKNFMNGWQIVVGWRFTINH